jgi:hypothetical protein
MDSISELVNLHNCERSDLSAEAFGEGGSNPEIFPRRHSGLLRRKGSSQ